MISYLKGTILHKGQNFLIVSTGDIGYKIFVNEKFFPRAEKGQEVELYTHQYVREDALDLYGFESWEQLNLFELLLSISGIGPKSALSATSVAEAAEFREYISRGDASLLTQVSGIGKRTADRIVVELRDKIGVLTPTAGSEQSSGGANGAMISSDEIDALMALGYSMPQAREALKKVDPEIKDSGKRIREALRNIE